MSEDKKHYYNSWAGLCMMVLLLLLYFGFPFLIRIIIPLQDELASEREAVVVEEMIEQADHFNISTDLMPRVLLALCAAFTLNFIIILFYSRKPDNDKIKQMSGKCSQYEINKKEMIRTI